jgi:lipopolysaccharide transport system ATP-binding protein
MDFNIGVGKYYLTAAIHSDKDHLQNCIHWIDNAAEFEIAGIKGEIFNGIIRLLPSIYLEEM